jgi:hypothetical protein
MWRIVRSDRRLNKEEIGKAVLLAKEAGIQNVIT